MSVVFASTPSTSEKRRSSLEGGFSLLNASSRNLGRLIGRKRALCLVNDCDCQIMGLRSLCWNGKILGLN